MQGKPKSPSWLLTISKKLVPPKSNLHLKFSSPQSSPVGGGLYYKRAWYKIQVFSKEWPGQKIRKHKCSNVDHRYIIQAGLSWATLEINSWSVLLSYCHFYFFPSFLFSTFPLFHFSSFPLFLFFTFPLFLSFPLFSSLFLSFPLYSSLFLLLSSYPPSPFPPFLLSPFPPFPISSLSPFLIILRPQNSKITLCSNS